mmetsp:Transcript_9147/g.9896  ORF Transcript_9147/g.9896 Transcript_9147/m.9896 type:complete len:206 (+) Transcript_9147:120-737(+)
MYGNYYHRRTQDRPLPFKKIRVLPANNLTARSEQNELNDNFHEKNEKTEEKKKNKGKRRRSIVHRTFKEVATLIVNAIRFEKGANFRKDGWTREVHGGVKMWVNQITGEVSAERPFEAPLVKVKMPSKPPTTTTSSRKKVSVRKRLSFLLFGSQDENHSPNTTVRKNNNINNNDDENDVLTEKGSSEIEEIFKMIDEEKKSHLLP